MDLRVLLFDRDTMSNICLDAANAVKNFPVQTSLAGGVPLEHQKSTTNLIERLTQFATAADPPLWELQWMALSMIYLSDTLTAALQEGTPTALFTHWFYGTKDTSIAPFRIRYENMVGGVYGPKTKRGSRKIVVAPARTCLECAVDEVILLHMLDARHSAS